MSAVAQQVWGWLRPWGDRTRTRKDQDSSWTWRGVTSWVWGAPQEKISQQDVTEEYWEAAEERARPPGWWSRFLPASCRGRLGLLRRVGWDADNNDADVSDYGTPPPSPTALGPQPSTFAFFARSWEGEVLPEHLEICFNFLRHLFDLLVVGFLWTVSPPAKVILDVLGVQGALKLWLHGMAMFFVSTVGMAGLLWLVQEYLPQFALAYGIVQALVISVSVRQSVIIGAGDVDAGKREEDEEEERDEDEVKLPVHRRIKGKTVPV
ncbi:uncharacterized protein LOC114771704 [Denticeps clupeoides]|uniref:Uncharacterized protein n=1 Tax=Denticeps clupeoides TaxID=299321 RepID=A0AAY4C3J9_9TELE|nr:uncharacterized protein LOC114771704 [Denticeps clupeoides]XP_028820843.1 uncharacterized protein LOC114771704 [Denticeps clupeoides]XP_028820845.1 uncharacterized protein LOC114771704 [Denticeps clupeoides]